MQVSVVYKIFLSFSFLAFTWMAFTDGSLKDLVVNGVYLILMAISYAVYLISGGK